MKAILEFDLPKDSTEYYVAVNGRNFQRVLQVIDEELHKTYKYDESKSQEVIDYIEKMRGRICELLIENSVDLYYME